MKALILQILLFLTLLSCCDAATLLSGSYQLAFDWIVPLGTDLVVFLIIRVTPGRWILVYQNDGINQILQLVMGVNHLRIITGLNITIFPCIFQDLQRSRHEPETYEGLYKLMHTILQPELQAIKALVLYRDESRAPHEKKYWNKLEAVLKGLHPNVELKNVRNILLPFNVGKELHHSFMEGRYAMTNSQHCVTYELDRDEEDEQDEVEITSRRLALEDDMSPQLLTSIVNTSNLGDELNVSGLDGLKQKCLESRAALEASTTTLEDACQDIKTYFQENKSSLSIEPSALASLNSIRHVALTRRSPSSHSFKLIDHVGAIPEGTEMGSTIQIAPYQQTLSCTAQIQHLDSSATDEDLSTIILHDEHCDRKELFKPGVMKTLLLSLLSPKDNRDLNATTLARIVTDIHELAIIQSITRMIIELSQERGYRIDEQLNAENNRHLEQKLHLSNFKDAALEAAEEVIYTLVESCPLTLNSDLKSMVGDMLSSLHSDMCKISHVICKGHGSGGGYADARALEISTDSIPSLQAIPRLRQGNEMSKMAMVDTAPSESFMDVITGKLAQLAIAEHQKRNAMQFAKNGGGKLSVEEQLLSTLVAPKQKSNMDEMEIDLESMMDDTGKHRSSSTGCAATAAASNLKSNDETKSQPLRKRSSQTTAQSSAAEPPKQKKNNKQSNMYSFFGGISQSSNSQSSTTQSSKQSKAGMYSFFGSKSSTDQPTKRKKKENNHTSANGGGSNERKTNVWTKLYGDDIEKFYN